MRASERSTLRTPPSNQQQATGHTYGPPQSCCIRRHRRGDEWRHAAVLSPLATHESQQGQPVHSAGGPGWNHGSGVQSSADGPHVSSHGPCADGLHTSQGARRIFLRGVPSVYAACSLGSAGGSYIYLSKGARAHGFNGVAGSGAAFKTCSAAKCGFRTAKRRSMMRSSPTYQHRRWCVVL